MKNYQNLYYSKQASSLLLSGIIILSALLPVAHSQEPQAFNAKYHVYRNNQHVGNAKFKLYRENDKWIWRMTTKARGFYSLLTRKKPYAETVMTTTDEGLKLSLESRGDYRDKPAKEKSWFNQQEKTIYYSKADKNKQIELPSSLYNFHSLHLLYPQMKNNQQSELDIAFYKKGEVFNSSLTLETDIKLKDNKANTVVDKLTQQLQDSSYSMVYYYQDGHIAPLKIEQRKKGKDASVMWRVELK